MKTKIILIFLIIILTLNYFNLKYKIEINNLKYNLELKDSIIKENNKNYLYSVNYINKERIKYKILNDSLKHELDSIKNKDYFLYVLGKRESGNIYNIVNSYGYLGKYQFGLKTLKLLGIETDSSSFLNNPKLQEKAMIKYLKYNKKLLSKYINLDTIKNKKITESGLLAASHLGGVGNVIKYLKTGKIFKDGYNTPITEYIYKFSGFNIDL